MNTMPTAENQEFSEQTLKGFLLKNVVLQTQQPEVKILNAYLISRVDEFWSVVVEPLKKLSKFDGNKINWYFEIYKEGVEAHKVSTHPFKFIEISTASIQEIVHFLNKKTLREYLDLGTSFLTNCFSLLSSWYRDQLILKRLKCVYNSSSPHEWILRAEEEEQGIMQEQIEIIPGIVDIITNIGLIVSHRV